MQTKSHVKLLLRDVPFEAPPDFTGARDGHDGAPSCRWSKPFFPGKKHVCFERVLRGFFGIEEPQFVKENLEHRKLPGRPLRERKTSPQRKSHVKLLLRDVPFEAPPDFIGARDGHDGPPSCRWSKPFFQGRSTFASRGSCAVFLASKSLNLSKRAWNTKTGSRKTRTSESVALPTSDVPFEAPPDFTGARDGLAMTELPSCRLEQTVFSREEARLLREGLARFFCASKSLNFDQRATWNTENCRDFPSERTKDDAPRGKVMSNCCCVTCPSRHLLILLALVMAMTDLLPVDAGKPFFPGKKRRLLREGLAFGFLASKSLNLSKRAWNTKTGSRKTRTSESVALPTSIRQGNYTPVSCGVQFNCKLKRPRAGKTLSLRRRPFRSSYCVGHCHFPLAMPHSRVQSNENYSVTHARSLPGVLVGAGIGHTMRDITCVLFWRSCRS